ncbi:DUF4114 domain-containing protein [Myxococcus sp. CA040A]|uniref:DUF4114 domain-containing protein n=1 Tax=Myxococcus sp. CA040A TaxID=2741738 RepID=UPI00157AC2FC|nr:DUF4114 domain-containing protein [Myxococcus sp. CA040A]NTX08394.1 hypothetical protein [Myxococcus sp. CA040A]
MLALLATGTRAAAARTPPPPLILGSSQSQSVVPSRGTARLVVRARDPQGGRINFTWTATMGELSTQLNGEDSSEITWTAPDCIIPGSAPVKVTVTNAQGLSSEVDFSFQVGPTLNDDHQPPFAEGQFQSLDNVSLLSNSALNYPEPLLSVFGGELMMFASDVELSLSFLSTDALASHSLGWMYYDDLIARGYVDTRGTPEYSGDDFLSDANNNGITDLHEDIYNLAPPSGFHASRPYIGTTRRCSQPFLSVNGFLSQPELAMDRTCNPVFSPDVLLADARPGQTNNLIPVDVVGALAVAQTPSTGFSDGGLFARIPNLLEPAAPANANMGLGHLAFLLTDDDPNRTTFKQLGPVQDRSESFEDGLPDYDTSAYTPDGVLRTTNPDPGITPADRTVKLGRIQAGREIVFFLITYYDATHDPNGDGTVYPCLMKAIDGRCSLHLKTSTSVFFSKPGWNLDQDARGTSPVAQYNLGCARDPRCNPIRPMDYTCPDASTSQPLCGWLQETSHDLLGTPAYGNLVLPKARSWVPKVSNGNMPHFQVQAVTTSPGNWILGIEDLNGGGDRDFTNVVLLLQATRVPGNVRSNVISPALDGQCAISRLRVRKTDWAPLECQQSASNFGIAYAVASDCNVCANGSCQTNPAPTWLNVPFEPGQNEAVMSLPPSGGSQLCWKARLTHPNFWCPLVISNVDIGYELGFTPLSPVPATH